MSHVVSICLINFVFIYLFINKQVVLELKYFDMIIKLVGLGLIHIIECLYFNVTWTWFANMKFHPHIFIGGLREIRNVRIYVPTSNLKKDPNYYEGS